MKIAGLLVVVDFVDIVVVVDCCDVDFVVVGDSDYFDLIAFQVLKSCLYFYLL